MVGSTHATSSPSSSFQATHAKHADEPSSNEPHPSFSPPGRVGRTRMAQRQCASCFTGKTPQWRRVRQHQSVVLILCNACALRLQNNQRICQFCKVRAWPPSYSQSPARLALFLSVLTTSCLTEHPLWSRPFSLVPPLQASSVWQTGAGLTLQVGPIQPSSFCELSNPCLFFPFSVSITTATRVA